MFEYVKRVEIYKKDKIKKLLNSYSIDDMRFKKYLLEMLGGE